MGSDSIPPKLFRMRVYTEVRSVHIFIPSHRLKRLCPRYMKHAPSMKMEWDDLYGWIKKQ